MMSVRTFFLVCLSAISVVALFSVLVLLDTQWQSWTRADDAGALASALHNVLKASERISIERGSGNLQLLAEVPAVDPASQQDWAKRKAELDEVLTPTRAGLASAPLPRRDEAVAEFDRLVGDLTQLRSEVAAALPLPKDGRAALAKTYFPRMVAIIDGLTRIADRLEEAVNAAHPQVGALSGIARLSWDIRAYGGRNTATLVRVISTGTLPTSAVMESLAEDTGQALHAWSRLQSLASQVGDSPGLAKAIDAIKNRFWPERERITQMVFAAARAGTAKELSAEKLLSEGIPILAISLLPREAAFEEAADRVAASRHSAGLSLAGGGALVLLLVASVAGVGIAFGRRVVTPLGRMTDAIAHLAEGNREVEVPGRDRGDEIGRMARALETLRHNAIKEAETEAREFQGQTIRARRQEEIDQLIGFFGRSVSGVFKTLAVASSNMADTSLSLETSATESGDQSRLVLAEVGQTAATVQTVAAASQELAASIEEIGRQAGESSRVSSAAMQQADDVVGKVAELREAAQQIGTVVELINSIASQTNLLALNATIEAARAGDAGKGFAVVANEVKSLATQTAKATDQIGGQIAAIQAATIGAAEAIQGIAGTIRQVSEIATSIASAVVEQSSATQEITRSVELVSSSTASVAQNMNRVSSTVASNGDSAAEVKRTAQTLSSESSVLSAEVKDFLEALQNLGGGEALRSLDLNAPSTVTVDGRNIAGRVVKLSPGFALFVGKLSVTPGTLMELRIEGIPQTLSARFVEPADGGAYLQLPLNHEHLSLMGQVLNRLAIAAAA